MKTAGIDIGSLTTKAVVLGDDGAVFSATASTGDDRGQAARQTLQAALAEAGSGLGEDLYLVSTGAGGRALAFSQLQKAITTCLARGIHHQLPSTRMVIDIGAESCTVVKLNHRGRVDDWASHDKCAAGTGIFLQQMSRLMQLSLEEMSVLSRRAKGRADITSTCAVFAESDVISHVHRDPPTPTEDIIAGIYHSVVSRIVSLCKRVGIEKDVAVAGGVALNEGIVRALSEAVGFAVIVPEDPRITAAVGAAVLARESMEKGMS